jgi:hypothetical protein
LNHGLRIASAASLPPAPARFGKTSHSCGCLRQVLEPAHNYFQFPPVTPGNQALHYEMKSI